jgi:uncharacterized protein
MADKSEHGHAGLDEERRHSAAHEGGHASHEKGAAHEFNAEEAAEAGRKGGKAAQGAAQETEGAGGDQATMPRGKKTRGGTHDQHVTAGKKGGSRIRQLIELGYLYEKEHGIGPGRERRRGRRKTESGGEGENGAQGEAGGREEAAVAGGGGGEGGEEAE